MARRSQMRTPKARVDEDEDASLLSTISHQRDVMNAAGEEGDIDLLGSGRSSVPSRLDHHSNRDELTSASPGKRSARLTMGNTNSHEEISAAVRDTAAKLNDRDGGRRTSNGKLKRPSASTSNPPYRNPTERAMPVQRRLGRSTQARPDTYAIDVSPEKGTRLPQRQVEGTTGISPRRVQKKADKRVLEQPARILLAENYAKHQQRVNEQLAAEQQVTSSPRRSRRQQEITAQPVVEVAVVEPILDTQAAHNKNWFPDAGPQIAEEEPDEEHEPEVEQEAGIGDGAEAREKQVDARPALVKKGSGRPKRVSATEVTVLEHKGDTGARADMEEPEHSAEPTSAKRKRGRPKGSSTRAQRNINATPEQKVETNRRRSDRLQGGAGADAERGTVTRSGAEVVIPSDEQPSRTNEASEDASNQGDAADEDKVGSRDGNDDNQGVDGDGEDDVHLPDDDDEGAQVGDHDENLPQHPVTGMKRKAIRPSEVFSGATGDPLELEDSPDKRLAGPSKRQRKIADQRARPAANSSQKRVFQPADESQAEEQESEEEEEVDVRRRFYGQWTRILKIYKAVHWIGWRNPPDREPYPAQKVHLKDANVGTLVNLCDGAVDKLNEGEDVASDFAHIADRVDHLCAADENSPRKFKKPITRENVYSHLFPALIKLLRATITTYETSDASSSSDEPLTNRHLAHVNELIKVTLDLGEGVKQYPPPHSDLALNLPVHNGIVAPLKKVHADLAKVIARNARARAAREEDRRAVAERARQAQHEAQAAQQEAEVRRVRDAWNRLHIERLWVEGGLMTRQHREHLQVPDAAPELDEAGQAFERVELFVPRIGPPPAMVEAARQHTWEMIELDALERGLRRHAGPDVFVHIFQEHCGRRGVLNKYNVTEIVTVAADLKAYLEIKQLEEAGEVEEWVKAIPVWTKGHPLGKENMDAEDDVQGDGIDEDEDDFHEIDE